MMEMIPDRRTTATPMLLGIESKPGIATGTTPLRSTFDALDMRRWWRGSLNDDLQLTRAVRSRGGWSSPTLRLSQL